MRGGRIPPCDRRRSKRAPSQEGGEMKNPAIRTTRWPPRSLALGRLGLLGIVLERLADGGLALMKALLQLADAPANATKEFRDLLAAEQHENDHEDKDGLGRAEGADKGGRLQHLIDHRTPWRLI